MTHDQDPAAGPSRLLLVATISVVAFCMVAALAVLTVVVVIAGGASAQAAPACTGQSSGGIGAGAGAGWLDVPEVGDLSTTQLGHARTWVAVGQEMGVPGQGIVVALATVSQETRFLNYANDGRGADLAPDQRDVDRSLQLPHDAVGTDHGSVGLAQQQYPWWGTLEELMDPATSARLFYQSLLEVPGWQSLPVTQAAQAVQRSAYGSAYADDEPLARQLLTEFAGAGTGVGTGLCGAGTAMSCEPTGLSVEDGLTPDALRVVRCVQAEFGDHTYGGVDERPDNPDSDHPTGRAVDVMVQDWAGPGNAHGWEVAKWVVGHATELGVHYVIWDAQIWSIEDMASGWQPYSHPSGRSSPTLDHLDHVHVSVYGNAAAAPAAGTGEWVLPLAPGTYRLTSGYGPRPSPGGIGSTNHAGLDFGAPGGTPIVSAVSGTVTAAGPSGGYGNLVVISSANVATYYAHMVDGSISVQVGQQVLAGQQIGAVGSTGNSTGAHLHFEIRVNGASTDPVPYLRQYGLDPGPLP